MHVKQEELSHMCTTNLMAATHFAFFLGGAPPTGDHSRPLVGRSEAKQQSQVSWSTHCGCSEPYLAMNCCQGSGRETEM